MKCPCEDCLCVPICQSKLYNLLVKCSLIEKYLIQPFSFRIRPSKHILKVEKILDPITWKCYHNDEFIKITLK